MSVLTSDSLILPVLDLKRPLLVGVSGGLDSVVLAHILSKSGLPVQLAHVNYGLRGAESDKDEELVRTMATQCGVAVHVLKVTAPKSSKSIQAWARKVRYDWLRDLGMALGARHVAVAHHQDDQLETMLLHLLRGTGLSGLAGMRTSRPLNDQCDLIRPLLHVSRSQVLEYARTHGLIWREDASNTDGRYARNQLRNELSAMPAGDYEAFLRAGMQLQSTTSNMRDAIDQACRGAELNEYERSAGTGYSLNNGYSLNLGEWNTLPNWAKGWIVLEILQKMDANAPRRASVVQAIRALATAAVGRKGTFGKVVVWRERESLLFEKKTESSEKNRGQGAVVPTDSSQRQMEYLIDEEAFSLKVAGGELRGRVETDVPQDLINSRPNEAFIDIDKLVYPLLLRGWVPGDRFSPIGLQGSQKIKSFLTNQKIPSSARKNVSVLVSQGHIAWVVGLRIDERFKVSPETTRILNVSWHATAS